MEVMESYSTTCPTNTGIRGLVSGEYPDDSKKEGTRRRAGAITGAKPPAKDAQPPEKTERGGGGHPTWTSPRNSGQRMIWRAVSPWTEIIFPFPRLRTLQPYACGKKLEGKYPCPSSAEEGEALGHFRLTSWSFPEMGMMV